MLHKPPSKPVAQKWIIPVFFGNRSVGKEIGLRTHKPSSEEKKRTGEIVKNCEKFKIKIIFLNIQYMCKRSNQELRNSSTLTSIYCNLAWLYLLIINIFFYQKQFHEYTVEYGVRPVVKRHQYEPPPLTIPASARLSTYVRVYISKDHTWKLDLLRCSLCCNYS